MLFINIINSKMFFSFQTAKIWKKMQEKSTILMCLQKVYEIKFQKHVKNNCAKNIIYTNDI